ncbi:MAG: hypothetical protein ACOY93_21810 [Bacillota bacterium]
MNRSETLERLKFLYDQVHQTAERREHLEERMPLHVHPASLNYGEDLARIRDEYNWLAKQARAGRLLTEADLEAEGLPVQFDGPPS